MTISQAIHEVKSGVRPGLRGIGCATIVMEDGARFALADQSGEPLLLRATDSEVEAIPAAQVAGEVEAVEWSCDESGAIYG